MNNLFLILLLLGINYVTYAQNSPFSLINATSDTLQSYEKNNALWSYRLTSFGGGNNGTDKKTKTAKTKSKTTTVVKNEISVQEYINQYYAIAVSEMQRTQVPASITLAQGILESGAGNSYLTRKAKNHFGILCHKEWRGPRLAFFQNGKKYTYRAYNSGYASYIDHSNFLENRPNYSPLFNHKTTDYTKWAKGLADAGYAEDPTYSEKIIEVIQKHQLYQYDRGSNNPEQQSRCGEKVFATPAIYNGIKTVIFDCDVSLQQIESGYKVKAAQIMAYNNLPANQMIPAHTMVFLEEPKRKGPTGIDYHIVQSNETIESIAKLYGIKPNLLYKRNKIQQGTQPQKGEQLALRTKNKNTPQTYNTQRFVGDKWNKKPMAITYTVKEGDTLYAISRRYNTSIEELRIVNSLPTDTIVLKQKLKVNVRWP